jgi:hypothetical protein
VDDSIDIIWINMGIVVTITILSISDEFLRAVDAKFNCYGGQIEISGNLYVVCL